MGCACQPEMRQHLTLLGSVLTTRRLIFCEVKQIVVDSFRSVIEHVWFSDLNKRITKKSRRWQTASSFPVKQHGIYLPKQNTQLKQA